MSADRNDMEGDILVVGTGAAGLSAALSAAGGVARLASDGAAGSRDQVTPSRVLLLTRGRMGRDGASTMAQGGVAAALDSHDSPGLHAFDTILAGAGLSSEDRVAILTSEGPDRVRELVGLGARFDREESGSLALAMEGAHSRRRVIHAFGDRTGAEVTQVLTRAVRRMSGVRVVERTEVVDLHIEKGRAAGVVVQDAGGLGTLRAGAVILATGGPCHLYLRTTTPAYTNGDGLAMADRAGARLADMEFVQFHPTAMAVDADPLPLVTEALRGEGATLVNRAGDRLPFAGDGGELSSRDLVARRLWQIMETGEPVFLDARTDPGAGFRDRFPGVHSLCTKHGIDPEKDLIPVTPAAHYHMGGIEVDEWGRTSLPGLWAAGEVASTGVHGANRLASNSLLEGLVFGARAGDSARREFRPIEPSWSAPSAGTSTPDGSRSGYSLDSPAAADAIHRIRTVLWDKVGVVRDATGLGEALAEFEQMELQIEPTRDTLPVRNALLVARRIAEAALLREESRGSHFRSDFPPAPSP